MMSPLWWTFVLFGLGMLLLAIDVLVPSGGALAILAAFSFASSVVMAFTESTAMGTAALVSQMAILGFLAFVFVRWWPHSPLGRRILIQRSRVHIETSDDVPGLKQLVGKVGVAKSPLLPAGLIIVDGRRYDAVSTGSPIEAGQAVEVVRVEMNTVVVKVTDRPVVSDVNSPDSRGGDDLLSRPIEELGLDSFEDPLS